MISTLLIIAQQALMHMPLIIGAYISIALMKVPDLSIETAFMCGALCSSSLMLLNCTMPLLLALIIALLASLFGGAFVGIVSSSITHYGKLPHLLSSIITFGIFHGLVQLFISPYVSLSGYNSPLTLYAVFPRQPEFIMLLIISSVVILAVAYVLKTQLGFSYAVFGNNPKFFRNYGISTGFVFMTGIILANALAGLSGYLIAQSNGFAEMNMGIGKVLLCITALILGKTLMNTKNPITLLIPGIGIFSYFALQQLMLKIGFNLKYFTMLQALIVLAILILYYRKHTSERIEHLGV
ncbi:MAG: hypothetical protein AB7F19_05480 [Candidatus Babeliales bacterium]